MFGNEWLRTAECKSSSSRRPRAGPVRQQYPAGLVLAVLALLALETPRAQPGFQAPLTFDAGSNPVSVVVGDFTHDGIADLAVANNGSNNVSVLLGKGDGTFGAAVHYATGSGPNSVAVADLNGDGVADLVGADIGSQSGGVLLGEGDGPLPAALGHPPAGGPLSPA